ncbi:HTH-type transcriptional regulator MalT [Vibrio renipiscarius]|uniref:HTH-type transcriptional regulator MalT n=1 Tax=Vibrio renipiscarius TaxID=1461322 RepID=A0A0C2NF01_9VIBR|nr:HTH-type transcriptional regulator MalT [Vibrio renipiscarius]KII76321.1 transcriptional regulator MalT [Vibrio renipiscarius]KII78156.1 transcriptional regulator MalT [Vibrio renipiscarius]
MWIPSKLTRPGRLHNAILRPRVLELLQQALYCKLVLFRSPAGYGKTTMAAQWLADKTHVGWYSIDEDDNDGFRFIHYLLQALNKATDNGCPAALKLTDKRQFSSLQFSSLQPLLSDVFVELAEFTDHAYVVLDDYHLIHADHIHQAMRFFIKHMPDNLTLVVTSRAAPALGIANLRVRDLMIEIDSERLAFDDEETARFFKQRLKDEVDVKTSEHLCQYVEGWPSALQLIALQAQHQNKSLQQSALSIAQFNPNHMWDYLVEEVFDRLDENIQQFVLQCSVLDRFNDTVAAEVTQRSDALSQIESLDRYGLFIHRLAGEHNWYRFHNLFAEFLTHERLARIPEQEQPLQDAAAQAWLNQSEPLQALVHAQKSKNHALITRILLQYGWYMFNRGEFEALDGAIDNLPKTQLYQQPKLCMLQAWLAQSQHRYYDVGRLLDQADLEMSRLNVTLSTTDQGEFNALRAQIAINQNQPEQALELAELALSQIDNSVFHSRIVATSVIGEVNHVLGNLSRALPMMQQTEKLARQYQVHHHALWAMLQQSEILIAQGYGQAAYDIQEAAFQLIEEQQLQQLPLHEFLLRIRAQLLWSWYRLEEAEYCTQQGLKVLDNHADSEHLHCYSMLARVAVARGELDKAAKFIEQINHLLKQATYHVDWTANASLSQILYWQAREDSNALKQWLDCAVRPEQARNHFTQLQWRNIARVQIHLGLLDDAQQTLIMLQQQADICQLVTDTNRNMIVYATYALESGQEALAKQQLKDALILTNQTGILGNYIIEGSRISPLLNKLNHKSEMGDLERHRAQELLKAISTTQRCRSVHFDEDFVKKLVNHPELPQLVRTSPLTLREWQVLGLIYSGFSNEQIAQELDVAGTTIKTHIRNLYQKFNITNRKEAITTAEKLLNLIGY